MKYILSASIPVHLHLEEIEVEAQSEAEAMEIFEKGLYADEYNSEVCKAIESVSEGLWSSGAIASMETTVQEI